MRKDSIIATYDASISVVGSSMSYTNPNSYLVNYVGYVDLWNVNCDRGENV